VTFKNTKKKKYGTEKGASEARRKIDYICKNNTRRRAELPIKCGGFKRCETVIVSSSSLSLAAFVLQPLFAAEIFPKKHAKGTDGKGVS
jgi:hypothetical protein